MKARIIKICPGKNHAWMDIGLGFPVRKPLGYGGKTSIKLSFLQKILRWIKLKVGQLLTRRAASGVKEEALS